MSNPFFINKGPFKIEKLLKLVNLNNLKNFKNESIKDICDLLSSTKNDITFFHSNKYIEDAKLTKAYACITKNELSKFKQDYESLQVESQALRSANKQLITASKNNAQVVGYADGENCCFCSCKVDSLAESLKLIKINE